MARAEVDPDLQSPHARFVGCDFTNDGWENTLRDALRGCAMVFHAAGEMPHRSSCASRPEVLWRVNVEAVGTLYRLAAEAGVAKFCFVSSVAVYGDSFESPRVEESPLAPSDLYARSKAAAEQLLQEGARSGGPATVTVRPGLIYGTRDGAVVQRLVRLIDGGYFRILGDGANARALTAAPLVADAMAALTTSTHDSITVNVIDPERVPIRQLADDIAGLLNVRPPGHFPLPLAYAGGAMFSVLALLGLRTSLKISDIRKISSANPVRGDRLRLLLGSVPDYYREALAADVDWYRQQRPVR